MGLLVAPGAEGRYVRRAAGRRQVGDPRSRRAEIVKSFKWTRGGKKETISKISN